MGIHCSFRVALGIEIDRFTRQARGELLPVASRNSVPAGPKKDGVETFVSLGCRFREVGFLKGFLSKTTKAWPVSFLKVEGRSSLGVWRVMRADQVKAVRR